MIKIQMMRKKKLNSQQMIKKLTKKRNQAIKKNMKLFLKD